MRIVQFAILINSGTALGLMLTASMALARTLIQSRYGLAHQVVLFTRAEERLVNPGGLQNFALAGRGDRIAKTFVGSGSAESSLLVDGDKVNA